MRFAALALLCALSLSATVASPPLSSVETAATVGAPASPGPVRGADGSPLPAKAAGGVPASPVPDKQPPRTRGQSRLVYIPRVVIIVLASTLVVATSVGGVGWWLRTRRRIRGNPQPPEPPELP